MKSSRTRIRPPCALVCQTHHAQSSTANAVHTNTTFIKEDFRLVEGTRTTRSCKPHHSGNEFIHRRPQLPQLRSFLSAVDEAPHSRLYTYWKPIPETVLVGMACVDASDGGRVSRVCDPSGRCASTVQLQHRQGACVSEQSDMECAAGDCTERVSGYGVEERWRGKVVGCED